MSGSVALFRTFIFDEPTEREERLELVKAAKAGDREALRILDDDFQEWQAEWRQRLSFLNDPGAA